MRTTKVWANWRRAQYFAGFATFFLLVAGWIYYAYFYQAPGCFDNEQNDDETGIDCGGSCVRICTDTVIEPVVKWSRAFRVTEGLYNAVAYVENSNQTASTPAIEYTFTLYDNAGVITTRNGTSILPPNGQYPIFEGRIETGRRVPTHTFIEIKSPELWQPSDIGREQFTVVDRELEESDSKPRLLANLRNNGLEEVKEVEVVATIFDANGTALAASRTFVDNFSPRSDTEIAFTWPEPIAKTIRSCEVPTDIVVAIDVSGSMNDDQQNPPEPISSVKTSAARFVNRLGENDHAGVTIFATGANTVTMLGNSAAAAATISAIEIASAEERGYTNTGEGIKAAAAELLSERHNSGARKVIVILTDGLATAPGDTKEAEEFALAAAVAAKATDTEIYAIGLGKSVKMDFVSALASSPAQSYQALEVTDVDRIYQTITSSLCEEGPAVIDIVPKSTSGFVPLR